MKNLIRPGRSGASRIWVRDETRFPPSFARRVPGFENQAATRPQGVPDAAQSAAPLVVSQEDLGHVAGHGREVDLERRQRRRIAVQPAHAIGTGLAPGHVEAGPGRVNPDHLDAPLRAHAGERAGATTDIQDAGRLELVNHRRIHVEIAAVGVQRVVDGRQPRIIEQPVRHRSTLEPVRGGSK